LFHVPTLPPMISQWQDEDKPNDGSDEAISTVIKLSASTEKVDLIVITSAQVGREIRADAPGLPHA
jgi:hypothetical protein